MIKLYCDTSNIKEIKSCLKKFNISGVTTNPSIMRSEGVKNYKLHCKNILQVTKKKPLSVEVFADNDDEIILQALEISKWSNSIFVKVPVINTYGKFLEKVIYELNKKGIKLNITAIFTTDQLFKIKKIINKETPIIVSLFCGRIADNGIDPEPFVIKAKKIFKNYKNVKILWASVREVFNFYQAKRSKSDIITVPPSLIKKIKSKKINLNEYSKKTVKQFFEDGKKSNFKL